MDKKQSIQVAIVVVAFLAAGFVLYKGGVFGGGSSPAAVAGTVAPSQAEADILPYGATLDFSKALLPQRFHYNQITYPQVSASTDVGINVNNLITNPGH